MIKTHYPTQQNSRRLYPVQCCLVYCNSTAHYVQACSQLLHWVELLRGKARGRRAYSLWRGSVFVRGELGAESNVKHDRIPKDPKRTPSRPQVNSKCLTSDPKVQQVDPSKTQGTLSPQVGVCWESVRSLPGVCQESIGSLLGFCWESVGSLYSK
jgi:hypothetical protein